MKILFTGGGTGGHVFPIVAIVREIKRISQKEIDFLYIGPKDEWANLYLRQEGIRVKFVLAGKIRRSVTPKTLILNLIDLLKIPFGIFQAFFYIFFEAPDLIFSKGGYGSIPVIIAGKILEVPIFLHESDISPGLANRLAGKFALEIFVSFPNTEYFSKEKQIFVGNPIRKETLTGSEEKSKEVLKLTGEKPVLLVLGGSGGAQKINDLLLLILPELLESFEVLHQCGSRNFKQVLAESKVVIKKGQEKYYHLFPFFEEREIKEAYFSADIVVSRAGSGAIFEIAAWGKPSILIPLAEAAQGHQLKNAYAFAKNNASLVIEEANLTPHFFLERLKYLISRPDLLERMSQKAKEFSKPRAAEVIASYLLEYLLS